MARDYTPDEIESAQKRGVELTTEGGGEKKTIEINSIEMGHQQEDAEDIFESKRASRTIALWEPAANPLQQLTVVASAKSKGSAPIVFEPLTLDPLECEELHVLKGKGGIRIKIRIERIYDLLRDSSWRRFKSAISPMPDVFQARRANGANVRRSCHHTLVARKAWCAAHFALSPIRC